MNTGDASRRRFGLVTRVNVRITETTFSLVRAYPRGLLFGLYCRMPAAKKTSTSCRQLTACVALLDQGAGVNGQRYTCDVARLIGCQPEDGTRDVARVHPWHGDSVELRECGDGILE